MEKAQENNYFYPIFQILLVGSIMYGSEEDEQQSDGSYRTIYVISQPICLVCVTVRHISQFTHQFPFSGHFWLVTRPINCGSGRSFGLAKLPHSAK